MAGVDVYRTAELLTYRRQAVDPSPLANGIRRAGQEALNRRMKIQPKQPSRPWRPTRVDLIALRCISSRLRIASSA